jgi:hypothetical protein
VRVPGVRRALRWTLTGEAGSGCWLAICSCGRPAARFPRRPDYEPDDPIAAAFGPARAPDLPPWIRVFQMTSGYPWWLPWRHVPGPCPSCQQRVTFAVWTRLAGGRPAYSELCLACGRAKSEYLWPRGGVMREAPVHGRDWSPPCVAVARLRRAIFSPPD